MHSQSQRRWTLGDLERGRKVLDPVSQPAKKLALEDGSSNLLYASGCAPSLVNRGGNLYYGRRHPDCDDAFFKDGAPQDDSVAVYVLGEPFNVSKCSMIHLSGISPDWDEL